MHYFSQLFHYDHPWAHVVIGMWHKYPNPHCSHVVTIDTLDRSVDPETGVIRTERILGCKQKTPLWVVKLFGGSEDAFVREVSFVDPRTQQATSHPDHRTAFHQTAEIQSRMALWRGAADRLEGWLVQRFEQNAQLGKIGFTDEGHAAC
ncbi:MSF1-domain-containing protein [Fomitopsis serialis]|uniref:MSF1-domain-containing protein n=1 Tax=Fomitopsis serialis TaxID=139415 RepID=UPI0020078D42|nr:MSF1-domain-containing protein [Neoantrodia serialis]KAH9937394.1 MSF1-domain-containing protein [Neoantrodia serialis]